MTTGLYQIVPATPELARAMAPAMREADRLEVWASSRETPLEALLHSITVTPEPMAMIVDGQPCAMWGVQPLCGPARVGLVWMLGTPALVRDRRWFWATCKVEVARLRQEWPVLLNWIDARYTASLRWARRLGFQVDEPRPFGPEGALFCCAAIVR